MSWFSRSQAEPCPPPASSSHRSLALGPLLSGLHPESRHAVLDLGPPMGHNLELLAALGCRIRITDLFRSLASETLEAREPQACRALFERLLPLDVGERFDAVLMWDLFDYLRLHEAAALMARITPACAPRAVIFGLVSTLHQIPATPLRYRIDDRETLYSTGPREPQRPAPRHTQPELVRRMPGFKVKASYILRHGVQEYLFERAPS